jgi:hypothetical protein
MLATSRPFAANTASTFIRSPPLLREASRMEM